MEKCISIGSLIRLEMPKILNFLCVLQFIDEAQSTKKRIIC